jgi:hypothetical protein
MLHHQQLIQQQLMQGAMQAGQGGVPIYQGRPLQVGEGPWVSGLGRVWLSRWGRWLSWWVGAAGKAVGVACIT